jgi:hypothetical protein
MNAVGARADEHRHRVRPAPAPGHAMTDTQPGDCKGYFGYPGGAYQTCANPPEDEGYCEYHVETIHDLMGWDYEV